MHSELAGRRIFITGISRGIGFATARLFLTEGASVFGVARDEARLTGARAALASAALTPDHFDAFPLELADADAPARPAADRRAVGGARRAGEQRGHHDRGPGDLRR